MAVPKMTKSVACPLPGLEGLEVVYNVGVSGSEFDAGSVANGGAAPFVVDIVNFELLGVEDADGKPAEKPVPLFDHKDAVPFAFWFWVSSYKTYMDAVQAFIRDASPN